MNYEACRDYPNYPKIIVFNICLIKCCNTFTHRSRWDSSCTVAPENYLDYEWRSMNREYEKGWIRKSDIKERNGGERETRSETRKNMKGSHVKEVKVTSQSFPLPCICRSFHLAFDNETMRKRKAFAWRKITQLYSNICSKKKKLDRFSTRGPVTLAF